MLLEKDEELTKSVGKIKKKKARVIQGRPKNAGNDSVQHCSRKEVTVDTLLVSAESEYCVNWKEEDEAEVVMRPPQEYNLKVVPWFHNTLSKCCV